IYCSTSLGEVRLCATLAISPSLMRGLWTTASCTSLFGSRKSSVRTSRLPFLFAHSIFLATPRFMICWLMVSRFSSTAFSSAQLVLRDDLGDLFVGPPGQSLDRLVGRLGVEHQHLQVLVAAGEEGGVVVEDRRVHRLVAEGNREDPIGQPRRGLDRRIAHGRVA